MGNSLRSLRKARKWTHDEAASRMGVSRGQFIKLERSERKLTERTIELAAKAFGVAAHEVLSKESAEPNNQVNETTSSPQERIGPLRDSDSILVSLGDLRMLVAAALLQFDEDESPERDPDDRREEAEALADAVTEFVKEQQSASVVVRLKAPARIEPGSQTPTSGGR